MHKTQIINTQMLYPAIVMRCKSQNLTIDMMAAEIDINAETLILFGRGYKPDEDTLRKITLYLGFDEFEDRVTPKENKKHTAQRELIITKYVSSAEPEKPLLAHA